MTDVSSGVLDRFHRWPETEIKHEMLPPIHKQNGPVPFGRELLRSARALYSEVSEAFDELILVGTPELIDPLTIDSPLIVWLLGLLRLKNRPSPGRSWKLLPRLAIRGNRLFQ